MANFHGRTIGTQRYELLQRLIAEGKTMPELAKLFDVDQETIRKFAERRNLKIQRYDQSMENHPAWKDGTTLDRTGYVLRRVHQEGPYGYLIRAIARRGLAGQDSTGYAPVHRIEMHKKLGRRLLPGEVVDHIDGDKKNNDPENLRLFASNAEHLRATLKGRVPNWTAAEGRARSIEGIERWRQSRRALRQPNPSPDTTSIHSKTDDQE